MINYRYIDELEGTEPVGSVPVYEKDGAPIDQSGVTVRGVDLGQIDGRELDLMDLSEPLRERLWPYVGLKRHAAIEFLSRNPLTLTELEAKSLLDAKRTALESTLTRHYNAATGGAHTFDSLPDAWQTTIFSAAMQHGPYLKLKTPNFWNQIVAKDWEAAADNLRAFQDKFNTRRNQDADYATKPDFRSRYGG